ncbi:MAG: spore germination protein, partial [Clostridiales bacterium 43-6]
MRASGNKSITKQTKLSGDIEENTNLIQELFGSSIDVIFREFTFGFANKFRAVIVYIEGLTDRASINSDIMKPLMYDSNLQDPSLYTTDCYAKIKTAMLSVANVEELTSVRKLADHCLCGYAALLIDGFNQAFMINCQGWEKRAIETPPTESVIRGPREGFTENFITNISLLRRKIKDPALTVEAMKIGEKTGTTVALVYIKGLTNVELIKDLRKRLKKIKTDSILESGYIEQFIEDSPFSLFSTIANTEKPDIAAAKILEGRAAIIVDGTPFVLTAPMLFIESFQSAEDYYVRPVFATLLRIIRIISFFISVLSPAIYVALSSFHQELIPTALLFTVAASREGVPFPSFIEAAIMVLTFEILREAGVRLPRAIGQAVSIVGALVIGQAAVSAGLVGAPMIIVVAITAVAGFVVPNQNDSGAVLRIILLILSAIIGLFGIMIGLLGT